MSDPLNDPRFPDRPQHPDFWRLAEAAMQLDGQATEGGQSVEQITAQHVDLASLEYVVQNRTAMLMEGAGVGLVVPAAQVRLLVQTAMLGGVLHGILFEKAGGHQ